MSLKPTWSAKAIQYIQSCYTERCCLGKQKQSKTKTNKQDDGVSNMGQSWPGRVNSTGAGAESDEGCMWKQDWASNLGRSRSEVKSCTGAGIGSNC